MGLFKKLDLWSVWDGLEEILYSYYDAPEKNSQYWDFYSDQINEMGILAADMMEELQALKQNIWYKLPIRKLKFYRDDGEEGTPTGISWFNTAACLLTDTDMV